MGRTDGWSVSVAPCPLILSPAEGTVPPRKSDRLRPRLCRGGRPAPRLTSSREPVSGSRADARGTVPPLSGTADAGAAACHVSPCQIPRRARLWQAIRFDPRVSGPCEPGHADTVRLARRYSSRPVRGADSGERDYNDPGWMPCHNLVLQRTRGLAPITESTPPPPQLLCPRCKNRHVNM